MNNDKKIFAVLFAIITTIFFIGGLDGVLKAVMWEAVPNILEYRKPVSAVQNPWFGNMTLRDVEELAPVMGETVVTSYAVSYDNISTYTGIMRRACVISTDMDYVRVYNLRMVRGGFWNGLDRSGSTPVVIGAAMAQELFHTTDVVGHTITIGNTIYRINGIYDDSYFSFMPEVWDIKGYIFRPYAESLLEDIKVDGMAFVSQGLPVYAAEANFSEDFQDKLSLFNEVNYRAVLEYTFFNECIIPLFFWIIVAVLSARVVKRHWLELYAQLSGYIESDYIGNWFSQGGKAAGKFALGILLPLVAVTAVGVIVVRGVYFPLEYLPEDNIFDIGFYIGKSALDFRQLAMYADRTPYLNLIHMAGQLHMILMVILILLSAVLLISHRMGVGRALSTEARLLFLLAPLAGVIAANVISLAVAERLILPLPLLVAVGMYIVINVKAAAR